jgi:hypothetical protein
VGGRGSRQFFALLFAASFLFVAVVKAQQIDPKLTEE